MIYAVLYIYLFSSSNLFSTLKLLPDQYLFDPILSLSIVYSKNTIRCALISLRIYLMGYHISIRIHDRIRIYECRLLSLSNTCELCCWFWKICEACNDNKCVFPAMLYWDDSRIVCTLRRSWKCKLSIHTAIKKNEISKRGHCGKMQGLLIKSGPPLPC